MSEGKHTSMSRPLQKSSARHAAPQVPSETRRPALHTDLDAADAVPSPARALIDQVEAGWDDAAAAEVDGAWSARRTLAFLLVTCGSFWLAIGWGVLKLVG